MRAKERRVTMKEINAFRILNGLKSAYRLNKVGERRESAAEHSWSCLLLADPFLSSCEEPLDRLKVYELLLYHDVVEIIVGDSPLQPFGEEWLGSKRERGAGRRRIAEGATAATAQGEVRAVVRRV